MQEPISNLGGCDAKDRENVVLQPAGGVMNFDWAAGATLVVCAVFGAGYVFKLIDRLDRKRHD
jgi:hypothetical protein